MRTRRAPLLIALLLLGALPGGIGSAGAAPRVADGSISGTVTDANNSCVPFDNTHLLWADAWDDAMNRYSAPLVTDGSGKYSITGLPGDQAYKLRFRVFNDKSELVAYWWFNGATSYGAGVSQLLPAGQDFVIDRCIPGFVGGTFKGTVSSPDPGFDPACVAIMAYEAVGGVVVGPLPLADASGTYRYHGTIPAGGYQALAIMSQAPACAPIDHLDQWWKGHSGPDLLASSNAPLFISGRPFVITNGAVTKGIHFDLMPIGTCDGKVPTIVGTTADDVIVGTAGPDVIMLYAGDDEAHGGNGKDTICGGKGQDNLFGDEKNDRIFGDRHNDYLTGGDGYDLIMGGNGIDQMFGGLGNDKMKGGSGGDLIHGNEDDDTLIGNKGDDNIFGGSGNDTIRGGPHNDYGDGGTGTDTCASDVETPISC